ncbi:hypothetical protein QBC38DRAFT_458564 [Podospora fimiseda]|uniref:PARP catalytic domain-containing protein n=1 Tax=Podospora fimiseda TaxID=252190 RepID=A0AAN7BJ42_9PEZI|nr:hypothetical protein QBC38DRAFT_458564 [Podospora fimiseda]
MKKEHHGMVTRSQAKKDPRKRPLDEKQLRLAVKEKALIAKEKQLRGKEKALKEYYDDENKKLNDQRQQLVVDNDDSEQQCIMCKVHSNAHEQKDKATKGNKTQQLDRNKKEEELTAAQLIKEKELNSLKSTLDEQQKQAKDKELGQKEEAIKTQQLAKENELKQREEQLRVEQEKLSKQQVLPGKVILQKLNKTNLRYQEGQVNHHSIARIIFTHYSCLPVAEAFHNTEAEGFPRDYATFQEIYVYPDEMTGTAINRVIANFSESITTEYRFHDCYLCSILRQGFLREWIGKRDESDFGPGFYSAESSVLSHEYAKRAQRDGNFVILVCKVATGHIQVLRQLQRSRTCPDKGYHSVCGQLPESDEERETVVYREDAIVPVGVVVYNWFDIWHQVRT